MSDTLFTGDSDRSLLTGAAERITELERDLVAVRKERDDERQIKEAEKKILLAEIEAHQKTKKERDALASALICNGHNLNCGGAWLGGGPCSCGVENAKTILAAHDAAKDAEIIAEKQANFKLATKIIAVTQQADIDCGFWKGRSELMQRQRDMRLAELTAKDAEIAALAKALSNLIARLDVVHNDPKYQSVWCINRIHAGPYTGPTYTAELAAARALLARYKCRTCDGSETVFDDPSAPCPACKPKEAHAQ